MKPEMREDRDAMFKIAALADGIQIAVLTPGHPRPPVSPAPQDLIPFSGLHELSGLTGTNSTHRDIHVILEINIFLKTHMTHKVIFPRYDIRKGSEVLQVCKSPAKGNETKKIWINARHLLEK